MKKIFLGLTFLSALIINQSCKKESQDNNRISSVPVLTTTAVTNISQTSALSGGNIISDGGAPIVVRGVCWDSLPNPTIADSLSMDGSGMGIFQSQINNLTLNTTYFVRGYAVNADGIGYGNQIQFTSATSGGFPVITLNGSQNLNQYLQQTFVDPGATAMDPEDGNITVVVSGGVNIDSTGIYTLTYTATDSNGNIATEHRYVEVTNQLFPSAWAGNYSCVWTTSGQPDYYCNDSIFVSRTLNNALNFGKYGNYSNAQNWVHFFINGNSVSIPLQIVWCGNPPVLRGFSGNGTLIGNGGQGSQIIFSAQETVNSITVLFDVTYTKL